MTLPTPNSQISLSQIQRMIGPLAGPSDTLPLWSLIELYCPILMARNATGGEGRWGDRRRCSRENSPWFFSKFSSWPAVAAAFLPLLLFIDDSTRLGWVGRFVGPSLFFSARSFASRQALSIAEVSHVWG